MTDLTMIQVMNTGSSYANDDASFNDRALDTYFSSKPDSVLTKPEVKQERAASSTQHRDPLSMIDVMLSNYIRSHTKKAEALAAEIAEKSEAVAEINRLWGILMTDNLKNVNPADYKQRTNILLVSSVAYRQIDSIIKNTLGDERGIQAITTDNMHNYDELQAANATMTAFSDTIQVDLDATQQEFKNLMTSITSAQEEIRDVRRVVISFAER